MANPSTTGPSGIGSEVLRRAHVIGGNDAPQTVLTVGTDMIVTVLSLIVINTTATAGRNLELQVLPDGGTALFLYQGLGNFNAYDTFVWNDKIVLTETDVLKAISNSTDFDCYLSYIEQEFA